MSLRICMVGCGGFAMLSHGPAQRRCAALHSDVELAGCCDTDEGHARAYCEAVGYRRPYADLATMLEVERPDAVVLAVPPSVTCEVATPMLEKGIPLLLEKPPGMSPFELRRLMQAAERGKVGAQVAFNRRYMPIMQRALEILRTAFGTPFSGRIIYEMLRLDRWDADFSTTAIHAVDAALFLAGSPFRAADLRFQTQTRAGLEAVDISFEAECASGSRVLINIQPVSGRNAESVRIEAVDQSLTVSVPFLPQGNAEGRLEHWRGDRMVASCSDSDCDSVERLGVFGETKGFLDALRFAGAFVPALEDCRQQVVLMEAFRLRRSGAFGFDAS